MRGENDVLMDLSFSPSVWGVLWERYNRLKRVNLFQTFIERSIQTKWFSGVINEDFLLSFFVLQTHHCIL